MPLSPRLMHNSVAACVLAASTIAMPIACAAPPAVETATMLREGVWGDGIGRFDVPQSLDPRDASAWPHDGWYRVWLGDDNVRSERVPGAAGAPAFITAIAMQLGKPAQEPTTRQPNRIFLRVPGASLVEGPLVAYRFKNGTTRLVPKLDFRYELALGAQPFAVTVQNGLRTPDGVSYGSGALYTIEYDGNRYEYLLGEFGWNSTIEAIVDLDGDGKPDFIISVSGNNGGYEAVLLSSQARPGRNVPTASLLAHGC